MGAGARGGYGDALHQRLVALRTIPATRAPVRLVVAARDVDVAGTPHTFQQRQQLAAKLGRVIHFKDRVCVFDQALGWSLAFAILDQQAVGS